MQRKRHIFILALIVISAFSIMMAGCGKSEESEIKISDAITEASPYDGTFQILNTVFDLPCKVSDLTGSGLYYGAKTGLTDDYIVDGDGIEITLSNEGWPDGYVTVYAVPEDGNEAKLGDCIVNKVEEIQGPKIIFAKGITYGSTIDELRELWGKETEIEYVSDEEAVCTYIEYPSYDLSSLILGENVDGKISLSGNIVEVTVSREDGTITNIFMTCQAKASMDETGEYADQFSNGKHYSFLCPKAFLTSSYTSDEFGFEQESYDTRAVETEDEYIYALGFDTQNDTGNIEITDLFDPESGNYNDKLFEEAVPINISYGDTTAYTVTTTSSDGNIVLDRLFIQKKDYEITVIDLIAGSIDGTALRNDITSELNKFEKQIVATYTVD